MRITDLLDARSVSLTSSPKTKSEALDQAVALMTKSGKINDEEAYRSQVYAREEESTTGIGEGIAIPHGKCDAVSRPGLAAMVIKNGVDFDSLDGEPVTLLFLIAATGDVVVILATVSMYFFLAARCILALGEAGNFPAAIKVTAEYFPKKDRAYATSIFNAGASIGALVAPISIPLLAKAWGWEMAFIVIGALGFVWMGLWVFMYTTPDKSKHVNKAELEYIEQDKNEKDIVVVEEEHEKKIGFLQCFTFKQTWAFVVGKFMTDGVWWFFLFWTPSYLNTQFGIKTSDPLGMGLIFTLYAITMLSIYGGKLPTIFINRSGMNPYAARMKAMLIFAFFPLLVLLAQPLGTISPWFPVIMIGIGGAAHQSWSANIFSTVGDMFPKSAIATVTGIGGMAGGVGSMILQKVAGNLFVYADATQMTFMGFTGKPAGYFIIFCVCAVAYLIGWTIMKILVPKYKVIVLE